MNGKMFYFFLFYILLLWFLDLVWFPRCFFLQWWKWFQAKLTFLTLTLFIKWKFVSARVRLVVTVCCFNFVFSIAFTSLQFTSTAGSCRQGRERDWERTKTSDSHVIRIVFGRVEGDDRQFLLSRAWRKYEREYSKENITKETSASRRASFVFRASTKGSNGSESTVRDRRATFEHQFDTFRRAWEKERKWKERNRFKALGTLGIKQWSKN